MTSVSDSVEKLHPRFYFELLRATKKGGFLAEFDCRVEAMAWVSDGRILGYTIHHSIITMRALKTGSLLFWEKKHCIDSLLHRQKPMKIYKQFHQPAARAVCRKLNDRIAALIAPSQRVWINHHNLAAQMMTDANNFLVAHYVMTS